MYVIRRILTSSYSHLIVAISCSSADMIKRSLSEIFSKQEPATLRNGQGQPLAAGSRWAAAGATSCRRRAVAKSIQKRNAAVFRKACRDKRRDTPTNAPSAAASASLANMFGTPRATSSKTCRTPRAAVGAPLSKIIMKPRRAAAGAITATKKKAIQRRNRECARKVTALAAGNQPGPFGKAKESWEQHQTKHRTLEARRMCLRCQYHEQALKRKYPWSAARRTGSWAIGCGRVLICCEAPTNRPQAD